MSTDALQPVAADQLRITVDMGDEFEPTDRVAAALAELNSALAEAEAAKSDDEVQGFAYLKMEVTSIRPFVYDSKQGDHFCSTVGNKQEPYLKYYQG